MKKEKISQVSWPLPVPYLDSCSAQTPMFLPRNYWLVISTLHPCSPSEAAGFRTNTWVLLSHDKSCALHWNSDLARESPSGVYCVFSTSLLSLFFFLAHIKKCSGLNLVSVLSLFWMKSFLQRVLGSFPRRTRDRDPQWRFPGSLCRPVDLCSKCEPRAPFCQEVDKSRGSAQLWQLNYWSTSPTVTPGSTFV